MNVHKDKIPINESICKKNWRDFNPGNETRLQMNMVCVCVYVLCNT